MDGCKNYPEKSSTTKVSKHISSGFSMSTVSSFEDIELLTKQQQESYENAKICYICKEKVEDKYAKDKNIVKLGTIFII